MSDSMGGLVPNFAEELLAQWNQGPRVFRNALRSPMFAEREFMAALVGAARDYAADPKARVPPGRIFLSGEIVTPEQLPGFLPRGAAETCDQYVSRMRQAHPRDEMGIILDNPEKHVPAMRDGLIPALHHVFSPRTWATRLAAITSASTRGRIDRRRSAFTGTTATS